MKRVQAKIDIKDARFDRRKKMYRILKQYKTRDNQRESVTKKRNNLKPSACNLSSELKREIRWNLAAKHLLLILIIATI